MSILFPKINKPREWDYRPIYYDPQKEERKRKLETLRANQKAEETQKTEQNQSDKDSKEPYVPTLHRGSFREMRDAQGLSAHDKLRRTSRLTFWIALLALLVFFLIICSYFTLS